MLKLKKRLEDVAASNLSLPKYQFQVGDTVIVTTKIKEDDRTRLQNYEGIVIAIKGQSAGKTFTVRRVGGGEIGVERIFPVYSPIIEDVKVKKTGNPRRSKLYYLRDRKGKRATLVKAR